jgi:hypothetical protein
VVSLWVPRRSESLIGKRMWEWDAAKNFANQVIHGVSFEEGMQVFGDPLAATRRDMDHSKYEQRFNTIGMTLDHRLLFVVHTWDDASEHGRIISVRFASNRERIDYESKDI